jgi:hypothetical protein
VSSLVLPDRPLNAPTPEMLKDDATGDVGVRMRRPDPISRKMPPRRRS